MSAHYCSALFRDRLNAEIRWRDAGLSVPYPEIENREDLGRAMTEVLRQIRLLRADIRKAGVTVKAKAR